LRKENTLKIKTPHVLTAGGVLLVIAAGLLLAGGADVLFPAPAPTALPTVAIAATLRPTFTPQPPPASLVLAYTHDTLGYLDPCQA
jgi:hypothetical protein